MWGFAKGFCGGMTPIPSATSVCNLLTLKEGNTAAPSGSNQGRTQRQRRTDAEVLPVDANTTQWMAADDFVVLNVEDVDRTGLGVTHRQIGFAHITAKIADSQRLPFGSDAAHRDGRADELAVLHAEDIDRAVLGVAHQNVGLVGVAAEVADPEYLPFHADPADRDRRGNELVALDVEEIDRTRVAVAYGDVALPRIAAKVADSKQLPLRPDGTGS